MSLIGQLLEGGFSPSLNGSFDGFINATFKLHGHTPARQHGILTGETVHNSNRGDGVIGGAKDAASIILRDNANALAVASSLWSERDLWEYNTSG
jgi:hypothetical protein